MVLRVKRDLKQVRFTLRPNASLPVSLSVNTHFGVQDQIFVIVIQFWSGLEIREYGRRDQSR
jgi:hypothetical protein